jgi:hypothetical protein
LEHAEAPQGAYEARLEAAERAGWLNRRPTVETRDALLGVEVDMLWHALSLDGASDAAPTNALAARMRRDLRRYRKAAAEAGRKLRAGVTVDDAGMQWLTHNG